MECPECRGKAKVTESREYLGAVYRRRVCQTCGFRFWTEEAEVEKTPTGLNRYVKEKYAKKKGEVHK